MISRACGNPANISHNLRKGIPCSYLHFPSRYVTGQYPLSSIIACAFTSFGVRLLGNILGGGSLLGARGGTNFSGSNKNLSLSSLPAHL